MPIRNPADAREVEDCFKSLFVAASRDRAREIRKLFVEVLDFEAATGQVSLAGAPATVSLPASAERIAQLDGVHVLYLDLNTVDNDRVRKAEVEAAAKRIADQLGEDMLLVVINKSGTQLHIIHPDFGGARLVLRRMVIGHDVPRRTVVQQISNIYSDYGKSKNLRKVLREAFDVEPVTTDFFRKYKEIFEQALKAITGFDNNSEGDSAKRLFTQTLFNRLMFVHFLSRKGWLSINDDKDYLSALWNDYQGDEVKSPPTGKAPNFYRDRLRLLFFTGLNNPDSRDLSDGASPLIGSVPFLNGGLFTEGDFDVEDSPVAVPDDVIEGALKELFEKFNFTVMESTPFDIEVAVDPEMLGKVFEELVNERHDSGAYYTPRPVVAFMCREALKGYLESKDTGVSVDAIAGYIENRDTGGISVDAARRIGAALDEITVVDPACGSGAFLLGMMQELVDLQTTLYNAGVDSKSLHALKLHIIERNLYGVDIDEFAVNIAMLRLWLSLAIDFDGATPPALPNLDFKIVRGDSLLGPDPSPDKYPDLFRYQVVQAADRIGKLKAEFMNTSDRFTKVERQDEIEALERDLTAALAESPAPEDAVDWRVQFAEVFARHGGFDVAIANPPYVRPEVAARVPQYLAMRQAIVAGGQYHTLYEKWDLYVPFIERSYALIRDGGINTLIVSDAFCQARYAKRSREYFLKNARIVRLDFYSDIQIFQAGVHNVSYVFQKADGSTNTPRRYVHYPEFGTSTLLSTGKQQEITEKTFLPYSSPTKLNIDSSLLLRDIAYISYGVRPNSKAGDEPAFVTGDVTSHLPDAEHIREYVEGKHLGKWRANRNLWIEWETERSPSRFYAPTFSELQQTSRKILIPKNVATRVRACLDEKGVVFSASVIGALLWHQLKGVRNRSINKEARYSDQKRLRAGLLREERESISERFDVRFVLGLLNSSYIATQVRANRRHNVSIYPDDWKDLQIPDASHEAQRPVIELVDTILKKKDENSDADVSELESQIDVLVYDLYGLTEEEIAAVEGQ